MVEKISFFSFENPRQAKDVFRFLLNRLCFSLEKGEALPQIQHQVKDLKSQAIHLQNSVLDAHLNRLENFLHQNWPLNEQLSLEHLQTLKEIFQDLNQETIF